MKAIVFDRQKQRKEIDVESVTEIYTHIMTDMDVAYKITYKLSFYDKKMRPVYTEQSRQEVSTQERGAN